MDVRSQYAVQVSKSLDSQLEQECKSSLDERLPLGWTLDDVREHVSIRTYPDEPHWEYYCFDGVPMFAVGPIYVAESRTERDSYMLTYKRDVIRLAPTSPDA